MNLVFGTQLLNSIRLDGDVQLSAHDIKTDKLTLNIGGKNSVNLVGIIKTFTLHAGGKNKVSLTNTEGKSVSLNLIGKNTVVLSGKIDELDINTFGNENIDDNQLIAKNVIIRGASKFHLIVQASNALDVMMFGNASVDYIGNPKISKMEIGRIQFCLV